MSIALNSPDLVLRLRDHFVNTKQQGIKKRSGLGHLRTRVRDIQLFDPDSGTYYPGGGQGDLQCATFWPPNRPKFVNKPNKDPAKDKDQEDTEKFGGYTFTWPAYSEAALTGGENAQQHLQNTRRIYGRLRPIRNMNLDTDKMYALGRIVGFEDDPNPPVNGSSIAPQRPTTQPMPQVSGPKTQPGPSANTGLSPTTTQGTQPASVAPPGGSASATSTLTRPGTNQTTTGRVSTTPKGSSTSGTPAGRRFSTFAGYMGQKLLGQEMQDNRMAASPLPGRWPMVAVAGSEKDGQHPIVLPANLNLLISDYLSRPDFVQENVFSTRLADLKRTSENRINIDKERISAISSALRVSGVVDEVGRSTALAWNVAPGVPFAGRGQFHDDGLLGSTATPEFTGGNTGAMLDPDPKNQTSFGQVNSSRNLGRSGYNSNSSNVPSGILNNSNVGGGLAGLVAGAGGRNPVQPSGGRINGLAGFGGGNPTPCTTIDPGQTKTTCAKPGEEEESIGGNGPAHVGYAGISGGGPISAGASWDRHFVGKDQDGKIHNQGHVHGFAPFHYGPQFCAPLLHEGEWKAAQDGIGVPVPVAFRHDSEKLHRTAGFRFGGAIAMGYQRWQVKIPFYIPPIPLPPWDLEDWFPPLNPNGKGGDPDGESVPATPKDLIDWFLGQEKKVGKGNVGWVSSGEPAPWTKRNSDPIRRQTPRPAGDFAGIHEAQSAVEGARTKDRGVASGQERGRKLLRGKEIIKEKSVKNQTTYIRHWMEQSFPVILATPYAPHHKNLKFERNPNKADLNTIECMPVAGRLEAWGAWTTNKKPCLLNPLHENARYTAGVPIGGGWNFTPGSEGLDGRSGLTEKPRTFFNFQDTILTFGTINQEGDLKGTVSDGMSVSLNPNNDLAISTLDAFGQPIENFTLTKDGDFSAARDVATGRAFGYVINQVGPGTTVATIGNQIEVTSSAISTIELPDPTLHIGKRVLIKDTTGQASTNTITITTPLSGDIDGAASQTITTDYGVMEVQANGTNWRIVGDALASSGGAATNNFSYTEVLSSETLTISVRQQMLLSGGLTLDGALVLDGELVFI
jgi:hypothetical protein